ncbi:trypsin-like serine peptidase [Streptomyces griseoruber]|uniref:Serine protease n=1 Tax=Streptomyces griseoruber TaxID=1943 RepID=A0A101SVF4_9ACTN|nr:serine protease [Streptomyces griseoruber]KUN80872.1 hypothetical protein AQJ64_25195 [Streptomyces griseoruber]
MVTPVDHGGWRARVHDRADVRADLLGSGFLVSPVHVLTCAHVIAPEPHRALERVWVDFPAVGGSPGAWASTQLAPGWTPGRYGHDLGLVTLDHPVPVRPAAVASAPVRPGDVLRAFGHVDEQGAWAVVTAIGADGPGGCVQVDHDRRGVQLVRHGYSGGPVLRAFPGPPYAVDTVVAMTVAADNAGTAWVLPAAAFARVLPVLRERLPKVFGADTFRHDPRIVAGLDALFREDKDYDTALSAFQEAMPAWGDRADLWYYIGLATLRGRCPRAYPAQVVEDLQRFFRRKTGEFRARNGGADPDCPHLYALWAVVQEDHYLSRGLSAGSPGIGRLRELASRPDAARLAELRSALHRCSSPTLAQLRPC